MSTADEYAAQACYDESNQPIARAGFMAGWNAARVELDRLRDGIKALIDQWQESADAANHWSLTVSDPYSQERARQRQKTCADHVNALRALLDGEAKG
ncbi:hypothetical protein [Galactobacter valiniphilus]|uniref:hypothetical protein n=1 Tax=Galactobacter valiniphilus TaxID=2676122 RepID=UPI00373587F6